jgi:broad specificity phosphatase PhoE
VSVQIVFETHSLTTDNESGIATGWLPGCLSAAGRQFARELGGRRRDEPLAAVFTSDLVRAVETAEIAFDGTSIEIHRDPRLRECDYGELNGMPVARLESERSNHIDEPFLGGESYRQVVDRVEHFLAGLTPRFDGERMLVIGHSATRWALDNLLGGIPLEELVDAPFDWREGWTYTLDAKSAPAG